MPVAELDVDPHDEVIKVGKPLLYDLEVQKLDDSILAQGDLHLTLDCECVRCLKPIEYHVDLPNWAVHLPMEGEEAVSVVNDCVDLTPYMREDILLDFPRHPLCNADCRGLSGKAPDKAKKASGPAKNPDGSLTWAELNKLKF